jgi:hypothetical protein
MYGNNDCMALFVALKYLLPAAAFNDYFSRLRLEIENLEKALPSFAFHRALHEMGLQGSWKKLDIMGK